MAGCRGGELHQHIINLVACVDWPGYYVMVDDCGMMKYLKSKKRPDFLMLSKDDLSVFIIGEVGRYNPDKWPTNYPVVHLGMNGRMSLINAGDGWEHLRREFHGLTVAAKEDNNKTNFNIFKKRYADNRANNVLDLLLDGKRLNEIADMGVLYNRDHSRKAQSPTLTREGLKCVLNSAFEGG